MAILEFPNVEYADEYGLLALGGDLEVESLLLAYRSGVFPWPIDDVDEIPWFAPDPRAVLFLKEFHVSKSLKKRLRQGRFEFRIDTCFRDVIECCANSSRGSNKVKGTWITPQMVEAYFQLHLAGYAHSVECFLEGKLAGGLYGVSVGKMFAGESMFFLEPDASKLALCYLVEQLVAQDVEWIDCQQLTPLFSSLGAREIPRDEFMGLLDDSLTEASVFGKGPKP